MKLSEIIDFNPRTAIPRSGDVPFIDMAALPTMGRDISEIGRRAAGSSGAKFANGDTLLARITPCLENGKGAKVSDLPGGGVGQGSTEFIVMRAKQKSDEEFVYYLSRHPNFRAYAIQQMSGTSGRQRVSWQPLADFEIEDLQSEHREAAGGILCSLDDKIELNRRMNATLELMVQAIFRDWFVDFGPVRRKMEGVTDPVAILGGLITDPTRAAEIAGHFPVAFGVNEAPEGWGEQALLDLAHWVNGAAYKNMHFVDRDGGLPVIKIAELKAGVTGQTKFTNTDLGDRYRINSGELLFSWSGNPDTSIDAFLWTGGMGWLNQHIFAVRENGCRTKAELYVLLKHLMPRMAEIARDKQTTGLGHVTKDDMKRMMIIAPSDDVRARFVELLTPIFDRIFNGLMENRILAEIRDYLLPRLLSGKVCIAEAERMAG